MRSLLLLLVCALGACSQLDGSSPEAVLGTWSGSARFLDRDLAAVQPELPVELALSPGGEVTGRVGDATMDEACVERRHDELHVTAGLSGPVSQALAAERKDRVVLILLPAEGGGWEGNLHLKTNRVFDPRMRVCGLELEFLPDSVSGGPAAPIGSGD